MLDRLDRRELLTHSMLAGALGFFGLDGLLVADDDKKEDDKKKSLVITPDDFAYFGKTFGTEYPGSNYRNQRVVKWKDGPRVYVHGSPSKGDLAVLREMIGHSRDVGLDAKLLDKPDGKTTDVYLVPRSEFRKYLPGRYTDKQIEDNRAFFNCWWNDGKEIYKSIILVDSDVSEENRSHTLREEYFQMLGLGRDSLTHPDSITYAEPTKVGKLSDHDRKNLRILYNPLVKGGMTLDQVRRVTEIRLGR